MPGNSFIHFGKSDVPIGESTHETHKGTEGWIEISDWSWDIEADTSFLKGAGASVGKPQPGTLSFSHYFDTASPAIMTKIVQGKHFPKVHIVMLKQTGAGDGMGEAYFGLCMEEMFITKVSSKGAEDGSVTQDVECVFKTVAVGYRPQFGNDPTKGGQLDKMYPFTWDIAKMKTEGVTGMDLNFKG